MSQQETVLDFRGLDLRGCVCKHLAGQHDPKTGRCGAQLAGEVQCSCSGFSESLASEKARLAK